MGRGIIVRGMALGLAALILNAIAAFLWVWLYSAFIDPGHDGVFYQAYGQRVAPLSGLIFGLPLLFAAGWLAGRVSAAPLAWLLPAATYALLDLVLMALGSLWATPLALILSYATKAAASYAGGWIAQRRAAPQ
jgi:hypothetical protein